MFEKYTSDVPAVPDPDFRPLSPNTHLYQTRSEAVYDQLTFDYQIDDHKFAIEAAGVADIAFPAKQLFEASKAQDFIDTAAVYDNDGRLNLHRTSHSIGIPFDYDMKELFAHGMISGEAIGGPLGESTVIHLNKDSDSQLLTFGHEIGHYFFRAVLGLGGRGYDRAEEDFCDYFGASMALPKKFIEDYETIDETTILEIMSRFQLNLTDTIMQLQRYKKLPSRVAIDTYNGRVKNPDYREKVTRGFVCLGCIQTGGNSCFGTSIKTPLFDFTDRAWGGTLRSCMKELTHRPDIMSTLTKYYMAKETQLVLFRPGAKFED